MADIELNELEVKSDAIPDDWNILLINPETGAVAKNMTVAKFVELFTQKQPEATDSKKGVVGSEIYHKICTKEISFTNPGVVAGIKIKTNIEVAQYGSYYFSAHTGMSQNTIWNQLIFINLKTWDYRFVGAAPISIGDSVVKNVVFYQDTDNTISAFINFSEGVNLAGGAIDLLLRKYSYPNGIVDIEGSSINYAAGSHSNEMIVNLSSIKTASYSLEKNALTDTISLNNSILPPPPQIACQKALFQQVTTSNSRKKLQTARILQYKLKNTSGRLRKSDRLFYSYRKKINNSNKSSISLIARYSKCNLPRAGPPRLIN